MAININKSIKRLQQFQWIIETLKLYEGNSILNDWMEKIIDSCFFLKHTLGFNFYIRIQFRMNCCNFVKVILARATKDKAQIDHFNSESDNDSIKAQYNNSLPLNIRYDNYTTFMQTFPKMHINSYIYFCQKVPHVQNYVYINTCYTTNNKNGEKSRFVNHFSLQDWLQLTNSQKM
jgi:hypothetical protein